MQNAVVMVYDVSKPKTFKKLQKWHQNILDFRDSKDFALLVIGCKSDLSNTVLHEQAIEYSRKVRATY